MDREVDAPSRQDDAEGPARDRQQQALGQHLPHQAAAAGA